MGFAIWTFDVRKTPPPRRAGALRAETRPLESEPPTTGRVKPLAATLVLYENCTADATYETAAERALSLAMRHGGVYLVRERDADGEWSAPTVEEWARGVAHVERMLRQQEAEARQVRLAKKLRSSA